MEYALVRLTWGRSTQGSSRAAYPAEVFGPFESTKAADDFKRKHPKYYSESWVITKMNSIEM